MNGEPIDGIQMRLGDSGEAFFLEQVPEIEFAALQAQQIEQVDDVAKKVTEVRFENAFIVTQFKHLDAPTSLDADSVRFHVVGSDVSESKLYGEHRHS